jgi:hypothetical protein
VRIFINHAPVSCYLAGAHSESEYSYVIGRPKPEAIQASRDAKSGQADGASAPAVSTRRRRSLSETSPPAAFGSDTGLPTMPGNDASYVEWALWYAAIGWPIFPCWPGTKTPLTTNGVLDATTDEATIRKWWARNPTDNAGSEDA